MNRFAGWMLTVVTCLISKFIVDRGLDEILWRASFDYVYPQYSLSEGSLLSQLAAATMAAALVSAGGRRPPSLIESWIPATGIFVGALGTGLVWSGIQLALSRFSPAESGEWLAPRGRVWFCDGLVVGESVGYWLGILGGGIFVWRRRGQRPSAATAETQVIL